MALSLPFPENTISSHYGPRLWNGAQTFHTGVDFAIAGGVGIPAAENGVVTHVEYTALKGYQVQIQHGAVARTRYHMLDASIPVRAGDTVTKGQTIGKVASQRYSSSAAWTGPHLHFEIWYPFTDGSNPQFTHMNPIDFIGGQSEPAGGDAEPIVVNPPTTPEAPKALLPTGESMKSWRIFRNSATGQIAVLTGGEFIVLNQSDYVKLRDLIRVMAGRPGESGWVVPPEFSRASDFFNLDGHGWALLSAINKRRG